MTIGHEFDPAPKWGGKPFNTPTNMAVSPNTGDVYITDGYGNSRVHRYSPDGQHLVSWGATRRRTGQFQIPHNVVIDRDEMVFVTDRENNRFRCSTRTASYSDIWRDIYRPQALCMDREGTIYIGEMLQIPELKDCPGVGHNLNVFSHDGKRLAHLGDPKLGDGPTEFIAPHGFGVDSAGNLYVGEVSATPSTASAWIPSKHSRPSAGSPASANALYELPHDTGHLAQRCREHRHLDSQVGDASLLERGNVFVERPVQITATRQQERTHLEHSPDRDPPGASRHEVAATPRAIISSGFGSGPTNGIQPWPN